MEGPVARPLAAALCGLLLAGVGAGCTSRSATPETRSQRSTATATSSATAAPPSAPLRVQVTHVAGRLSAQQRRAVAAGVRRSLASYVDGAFLGGHYPRSDFSAAFGVFTAGAAPAARRDQALLTNRPLGATTAAVRAVHRTAYLSVLSPGGHVSGVTAAVDLVFAVDRGREAARQVHLKGRMLLTRGPKGGWAVFGYDLSRSQTAARSAS